MSSGPSPLVRLGITGMSCAGCVSRVEKALQAVPGVESASVNLVSQQADIHGDVPVASLVAAVTALGYSARPLSVVNDDMADAATLHGAYPQGDSHWRDVVLSSLLTMPLITPMLLSMAGMSWHLPAAVQAALASIVQIMFGARFYRASFSALRHGSATMDVLVALGTTGAWGLSLYLSLHGATGPHGLYFETSAVIITLVLLGRSLEQRARHRTRSAVEALGKLQPLTARQILDHSEHTVAATALRQGDMIRVLAGETLPADGRIVHGESQVDESMLTGESLPLIRRAGDRVAAGTLNLDGILEIEVTASGRDTTLAAIIAWVESAQAGKAPIQKLADRVSAIFVPVVVLLSAVTLMMLVICGHGWEDAIIRAVTVLVIACPCALGLATPVALMAGTGAAARAGILIRDIDALERAASIDSVAFDKTGTLTLGQPSIVDIKVFDGDSRRLLAIATGLQACTTHPLADAFRRHAQDLAVIPIEVSSRLSPGLGVRGAVEGADWVLGNEAWLQRNGISTDSLHQDDRDAAERGETLVWLACLTPVPSIKALFALADAVREEAGPTLQRLRAMKVTTLMITGDHARSARRVASRIGIDSLHADVLPAAKAGIVESIREAGKRVAMVGDGINDAPALASADLGIALGSGSDIARHTAAITLVGNGLARVPDALVIARRTRNALRQNLFFAFAYNVIGIPLAMAGHLDPMIAAAAMAASSLSVVANALRLNRWRPGIHTIAASSPV